MPPAILVRWNTRSMRKSTRGYKFGRRKREFLQRGDSVVVKIRMVITTPTTLAYVHGRIDCTI